MKALAFSCAQNADAWQVFDLPQPCSGHLQEGKWWVQSGLCGSSGGESPCASHRAWCPQGRTCSRLLVLLQRTLLQCRFMCQQLPASGLPKSPRQDLASGENEVFQIGCMGRWMGEREGVTSHLRSIRVASDRFCRVAWDFSVRIRN